MCAWVNTCVHVCMCPLCVYVCLYGAHIFVCVSLCDTNTHKKNTHELTMRYEKLLIDEGIMVTSR